MWVMVRILAHLALTENPLRHRFHTVCRNFETGVAIIGFMEKRRYRRASNYTVYSGLSDGIRLSPVICCPFLELLGAPIMPAPFGVSSHFA
jgi:hypothetical protein